MRIVSSMALCVMFLCRFAFAGEPWQRHLPPEWLGVVVVNDLPEFDRQSARLAEMFGMEAPGLGRLLESAGLTSLTDAKGTWLAGLARGPMGAEEPYPFVMIPVKDFAALVKALDGDMRGTTAVVTLAQQDLLAGDCGKWTLLMNLDQQEIFESVMARDARAADVDKESIATDGIAAAHVPQLGLNWLAAYPPLEGAGTRERAIARRKRGVAMLSLEGVRESLTLDKPLWEWVAATFLQATVTVGFDEAGGVRVKVVAAKSQSNEEVAKAVDFPEVDLLGMRPWISLGGFQSSPELARLAAGLQIVLLTSAPEELGVKKFAAAELGELEKAIEAFINQITVGQFATLAGDKLPVYANRVAVLQVGNANDFLKLCDEFMEKWNALMLASNSEVKVEFKAEPVDIAGVAGRRYCVDMVEAVDVPRSKEIVKVMTQMFGPEGFLNWFVIPTEGNHVVVANVPQEDLEKLLGEMNNSGAKPQAVGGTGAMQFDASAYVDWGKRRDLAMTGEVIGGPKFVPLPKSDPLDAELAVRDGKVELEVALPQSLLETLGKHLQEVREP